MRSARRNSRPGGDAPPPIRIRNALSRNIGAHRGAPLTNKQVAEQIGALARQIGRMEKSLEDVDKRLTAQLGQVIDALKSHNARLANVERVVTRLETDVAIVKHATLPEAVRPVSIRRSLQKPPAGS